MAVRKHKKITSYQKGIWAEYYAEGLLRIKGYRILARRYKTPFGEIDLVAQKGAVIIAVEVKYRTDIDQGLEAVHPRAQQRITSAAHYFLGHHPQYEACNVRFDILTVSRSFFIRHHKNAWYAA